MSKFFKEEYLSEFVYGGLDGIVTTFAVVSAVAGAGYEPAIMLVLGFANLISDGISMGFSSYLAEKAEVEQYRKQRNSVVEGLEKGVSKTTNVIKKNLKKYGFAGASLESGARQIAKSKKAADFILKEEHGLSDEPENPQITGVMTFTSFLIFGLIPLLPYVVEYLTDNDWNNVFVVSIGMAGLAFAAIGYMKSRVTDSPMTSSIIETLILGAVASGASYFIGRWLESIIS